MELIVVLVIISIFLAFTLPGFSGKIFRDDRDITINWIVLNTAKLKKEAVHQGKNLFMCINPGTNTISIRKTPMGTDSDEEDKDLVSEFILPEGITLNDVELNTPGKETETVPCIQFYKKGYSDPAIIHITDNEGTSFSCLIQPFLHKVMVYEDYLQFE